MLGGVKIDVDPCSADFPFQQLAEGLRAAIADGRITRRMPPMSEIAADSGVAVGTVQRAYALLVEEVLIRTVKGRGTFVIGR